MSGSLHIAVVTMVTYNGMLYEFYTQPEVHAPSVYFNFTIAYSVVTRGYIVLLLALLDLSDYLCFC